MRKWVQSVLLVLFLLTIQVSAVAAQDPIVRALLFYSPTCPHCATVITEVLPPILEEFGGKSEAFYIPPTPEEEAIGPSLVGIFGESLEILYINVLTQLGGNLYQEAVEALQIPPDLQAVPTMIVGDYVLVGGIDVPEKFPGIIEEGLARDGFEWLDLPSLPEAIDQLIPAPTQPPPTEEPTQQVAVSPVPSDVATELAPSEVPPSITQTVTGSSTPNVDDPTNSLLVKQIPILDRIKLDPVGNGLAIIVLIGMVISVAMVSSRLILPDEAEEKQEVSWLIPVLCVIGMGIAAYLTYVETSGTEAVCGPVGDCNTVQGSEYAILFGFIPVGALGLAGYIGIILAWLLARLGDEPWIKWAKVALLGMSLFGTVFSIYLTFLEPFVIGATCMWCLTSAVIMTFLMWLTVGPGTEAIAQFRTVEEG